MALRFFALATLAALATVGVSSAVAPVQLHLHAVASPGDARLYAIGTRSAQQRSSTDGRRMDSVLADLSRHLTLVRTGHQLADLHSLSPAAKFVQSTPTATPLVLVDAVTRGDPQALKAGLESLGLEHASVYANDVGGWLPVTAIGTAAARAELVSIRAAMPHTRGVVALQGDYVQHSALLRSSYPAINGAKVTVGVLSDSFNCYAVYAQSGSGVPVSGNQGYAPNGFTADYATDQSTGALPATVDVLQEGDCLDYGAPTQTPFTDEGRAMLQVVHAVAPGAALAFYGPSSEADFANGIKALAAAGAKVIADDLGYFDEPFFQDGLVAEAVDTVEAGGAAYFSAAGNDSNLSYENLAPSFATAGSGSTAGEFLLNFDTTGATNSTSLPVSVPPIPPGDFLAVVVEWDQPYVTGATGASPGATSSIDLCVTGATGSTVITDYDGNAVSCTGANAVGVDPVQILIIGNPANAAGNTARQTLNIMVGLSPNSAGTITPGRVIVSVEDDGLGSTIDSFATGSATIQGHPGAAGAAAVGAAFYFDTPACGTSPAQLESFSSEGGAPILFDTAGTRLATPVVRQKPDFVGPDGINTTFLGYTLAAAGTSISTSNPSCQNDASYPNFFGTSAATPHAAGIAALALQANTATTPTQIYGSMRSSALPMSSTTPNFNSGYGFIQADAAFVVPTLTLAAPSIPLGSSTTLSWSTLDASSCTASGGWSGTKAASGSITVTPASAGTTVYTLTCTGPAGTSAANSASLAATSGTVAATPSLTLASTSVAVGQSTTISWSSANAASCTASGSWSGTLAAQGSQTVTPEAVGTETFTLTCSNNGGTSAPVSVSLKATAALVVPAAPTLVLGSSSIAADTTTTIKWTSVNASSCTASGNANAAQTGWQGTQSATGTFTVSPETLGAFTYSLFCTNSVGNSPTTSVTLTVTAAVNIGSTSGYGGLDWVSLLALGVVVLRVRVMKPADKTRS